MRINHRLLSLSLSILTSFCSVNAWSSDLTLPTLTQDDFNSIMRELSANATLHNVAPPSSMGSIFGFELGIVGGAAATPDIDGLVKKTSSGTSVGYLPHVGLIGAVTVPFGITGELAFIPKVDTGDIKFQQLAVALKWTLTDTLLPVLPVNIAVRGFMTKTEFSFQQIINNASTGGLDVNASVTHDNTVSGLQLMVSPKFIPVIEPYAGIGAIKANAKLGVNAATGTLFDFTNAQSAETSPTSTQVFLGVEARMLLVALGFEYSRIFDTNTYTGKLSFKF